MKPTRPLSTDLAHRRPLRRFAAAAALSSLLLAGLLAGCGGGGGGGGDVGAAAATATTTTTTTATATAFTQGTITGFGSVIVNGVRFDDSAATVTDDDGGIKTSSHLRLGMQVEVDSGLVDASAASARASAVRFGGRVTGPVSAVDTAAGTLTVLGQVVDVTTTTVFDDSLAGGPAALVTGAVVEVHGLADAATGHVIATRIEAEAGATAYKLRGSVAALDTTAKTFSIGGAAISYAGLADSAVPATLANGVSLRVTLAITQRNGFWVAQSLGLKRGAPADGSAAHLRGAITAFSSANTFSVDGLAVDASTAAFPDGSAGLALGVQVEVHGTVSNGVLVANRVSLESRHRGDDDRRLELHGAITAVDATAKTFQLRGVTVSYAGAVTYERGTEAGLVVGAQVEVKGGVGSTRTQLAAVKIKFES